MDKGDRQLKAFIYLFKMVKMYRLNDLFKQKNVFYVSNIANSNRVLNGCVSLRKVMKKIYCL